MNNTLDDYYIVREAMPKFDALEHKYQVRKAQGCKLANDWLLGTLEPKPVTKEGINRIDAIKNINILLDDYRMMWEHKMSIVGWMIETWFDI